jgi:putative acetyltransferase
MSAADLAESVLLEFRAEQREDEEGIAQVHRLAFGRDTEANIVRALRASPHFIPELSLVAMDGSRVVGHILLTHVQIRGDAGLHSALSLAPMGVVPDRQRHGIGSALIGHALREARDQGHGVVVVLGHADYYPRFGFVPASRAGIRPPFVAPDAAFMVCELRPGDVRGMSGIVQYPPEFSVS